MSNLEKRALRAGSFVHNNGKVLRTVNILRLKYNKLTGVQSVLEDDGIAEDEFLDSVNFLTGGLICSALAVYDFHAEKIADICCDGTVSVLRLLAYAP